MKGGSLIRTSLFAIASIAMLASCGGGSSQQPIPRLTITTASVPNGILDSPYSQTIQASGGVAPFTWSVTGSLPNKLALSGSPTNTVTISGTPDTAAQGVAFTIKVTDSAQQSATQSYTVSILSETDTLTLAPSNLSFGQLVGTVSGPQGVTVSNGGASVVVISGIALTGTNATDFSQSTTCGSGLAAGTNCAFNVTFAPGQVGSHAAAIVITDNTMGSPHSVSLYGAGLAAGPNVTLSATSLDFGAQTIGYSGIAQSVDLTNYGTITLSITSIAATSDFSDTTSCGPTLASGATCNVSVTFTPTSTGSVSGTLSIADNATGSPQSVSLSGTGVAGRCNSVGEQCKPGVCCPGLVCRPYGLRGRCEP